MFANKVGKKQIILLKLCSLPLMKATVATTWGKESLEMSFGEGITGDFLKRKKERVNSDFKAEERKTMSSFFIS